MDIVVLVKQVPDTESLVQIAADGVSIKKDDIKWVMNPYDEIAVEEALRIKEAKGGTVTVLSVGPQKVQETIRTALAMGADKGIHVNDPGRAKRFPGGGPHSGCRSRPCAQPDHCRPAGRR
jgi:electron transfer flavoprotein beta subunit